LHFYAFIFYSRYIVELKLATYNRTAEVYVLRSSLVDVIWMDT